MLKLRLFKVLLYSLIISVTVFCLPVSAQTSELAKLNKQLSNSPDSIYYVNVLNRIGFLTHMKSADSCLRFGVQGKTISDRLHFSKGKADAQVNIATALFLKGLYSQALTLFTRALVEYEKEKDTRGIVAMLMNSAVIYNALGDTANSVRFAEMAMSKGTTIAEDSTMSMQYANYQYLGRKSAIDSSDYYLDKAYRIATRFKDDRALLVIRQLRSEQLMRKGRADEALPLIKDALNLARLNQLEYHEIVGLNYYANYFIAKNQIDSAIACYDKIYSMASSNGFVTFKTEVLKSMAEAYTLKNDQRNLARINALLVVALEEESRSNRKFIGDYIAYNNAEQELNQLELNQKNDQKKIYLLAGFALLALGTMIYILYLNKKLILSAEQHMALNEKVTSQNELLLETDQFKASLISMLAHDFRSPLASILGILDILKDNDIDKSELEVLYTSISKDVQNTLQTFDNILLWVKKQYKGYMPKQEVLSVHNLMSEAASMHETSMASKRISFVNAVPESVTLKGDKEIIQFINRNLIHNAVKFSPDSGSITIHSTTSAEEIIISVKDEGAGMTEKQIQELFSFGQKNTGTENGAGIALTICKEFIDKLNGRIWSESGNGKGTTFFYALPLSAN
jgi:signal transduction histidine kinase